MPREMIDPAASFVPRGARTVHKKVAAAGWAARMTRAIGPRIDTKGAVPPEDVHTRTIALAAQSPDRKMRLVWVWRWRPERPERTVSTGRTFKAQPAKWELDEVSDGRTGRILTSAEAEGMLT